MEVPESFEEPSLRYGELGEVPQAIGGWSLLRDERFARLIEAGLVRPGDVLTGPDGLTATVTDDYGISLDGNRYESPDAAATAITGERSIEGWEFWRTTTKDGTSTLASLEALASKRDRSYAYTRENY